MILVTGATGNVGRALVAALDNQGHEVVAAARSITHNDVPQRVTAIQADLAQPETLASALKGVDAAFLMTPPSLQGQGASLAPAVHALHTAGVKRIVLLSSQGVGTGRHPAIFEQAVKESGIPWTILRPGGFAANTLWWSEPIRASRVVAAPFADVALPLIDPTDIAEVAAIALTHNGHEAMTYTLTGPAPISPRQQVAALSEAIGEPIQFVEQTRAEAKQQLLHLMPEQVAEGTLDALGTPTPEEQAVSATVTQLTGRPPRTFAEWALTNAAAFK